MPRRPAADRPLTARERRLFAPVSQAVDGVVGALLGLIREAPPSARREEVLGWVGSWREQFRRDFLPRPRGSRKPAAGDLAPPSAP